MEVSGTLFKVDGDSKNVSMGLWRPEGRSKEFQGCFKFFFVKKSQEFECIQGYLKAITVLLGAFQ